MNIKTNLPYEKKPADYGLIYIGTPVWAFTFDAKLWAGKIAELFR